MFTLHITINAALKRRYVASVVLQAIMFAFALIVFSVSLSQPGHPTDTASTDSVMRLINVLGSIAIPFVFTVLLELLILVAIIRCQFSSVRTFILLSGFIYVWPLLITVGGVLLGRNALVFVAVLALKGTLLRLSSRLAVA